MTKITLNNVGSLIDATTAANTINANNATLVAAFDNTLSRDGSSPSQMEAPLDMNSKQIINLPSPATATSPLRLQDLNSFVGGGTVTNIPSGGTTGQKLTKTTNANYDVSWQSETGTVSSVALNLPSDFVVTGSPVTSSGTLAGTWAATPTGTGAIVRATSPTLVAPTLGVATATTINKVSITAPATGANLTLADGKNFTASNSLNLVGTDSTSQTFPSTNAVIARTDAAQTFTGTQTFSSTIAGSVTGNAATVTTNANLTGVVTSVGNATSLSTSPTITTPNIVGVTSGSNATAGSVGELQSATLIFASALPMTSNVAANVTQLTSLPAGDWDIEGSIYFTGNAATTVTYLQGGIGTTTATIPGTGQYFNAPVSGTVLSGGTPGFSTPTVRFNISTPTTIYLVASATFAVNTLSAYGTIRARRVR